MSGPLLAPHTSERDDLSRTQERGAPRMRRCLLPLWSGRRAHVHAHSRRLSPTLVNSSDAVQCPDCLLRHVPTCLHCGCLVPRWCHQLLHNLQDLNHCSLRSLPPETQQAPSPRSRHFCLGKLGNGRGSTSEK